MNCLDFGCRGLCSDRLLAGEKKVAGLEARLGIKQQYLERPFDQRGEVEILVMLEETVSVLVAASANESRHEIACAILKSFALS